MPSETFDQLNSDFQTLSQKLKDCTDREERKQLLSKMKTTVDKLERADPKFPQIVAKIESVQLPKPVRKRKSRRERI